MKNTTQILAIMIQEEKEYSRNELVDNATLTLDQVHHTLSFLKKCSLIKVRYIKTNTRPYRRALYSLNPEKYENIIKLVSREVNIV